MNRLRIIQRIFYSILLAAHLVHTGSGFQNQGKKIFLFEAVRDGKTDILVWLLQKDAYVDYTDEFGRTPLMAAAEMENGKEIVEILVDAGADTNLKDKYRSSALHIAVAAGRTETAVYLKNKTVILLDLDKQGRNVIHLAAEGGHHEMFDIFLSYGMYKTIEKMYDIDGLTPLHYAARAGQINILNYCKKHSLDMNLADKKHVVNLLIIAATNNQTETVKFLIDECQVKIDVKDGSLRTPLHLSSMIGNTEIVTYLIEKEVDMNGKDIDGKTPLHLAVERGYTETAMVMIKHGAIINTTDIEGNNLLHAAAESGNMELLSTILNTFTDFNEKNYLGATALISASKKGQVAVVKYLVLLGGDVNMADSKGYNTLHAAAASGNVELINYLLDSGVATGEKDKRGMTPLHYASEMGNVEAVKILIEAMSNDSSINQDCIKRYKLSVNILDESKRSPAYIAAAKGHIEVLKILHSFGADLTLNDVNLTSPFQVAASNGKVDILKFLALQGVNINKLNNKMKTALYLSAEKGQLSSVLFLIDNSANLFLKDINEKTAMHVAAENGHSSIVKILGKFDELFKTKDKKSRTPGWYAASRGFFELVKYLLKVINITEREDLLLGAVEGGHLHIVKYLIWNGVSKNARGELSRYNDYRNYATFESTLFYSAIRNNHKNIIEYFIEDRVVIFNCSLLSPSFKLDSVEVVDYFISRGCDINMKDFRNNTLLHYAVEYESFKVLEYLLGKGADPNIRNEAFETPFENTCKKDSLESLKLFLKHGYNLRYTNSQGQTLVHIAARKDAVRCLEFLIKSGLNINVKDLDNKEPFHYALSDDKIDVLRLLLKSGADPGTKYDSENPLWKTYKTKNLLAATCLKKFGASFDTFEYSQRNEIENNCHFPYFDDCNKWKKLKNSNADVLQCENRTISSDPLYNEEYASQENIY